MSCNNCETKQEDITIGSAYYRWKNANVEMNGCNEHLREIFDVLNAYQFPEKEKES